MNLGFIKFSGKNVRQSWNPGLIPPEKREEIAACLEEIAAEMRAGRFEENGKFVSRPFMVTAAAFLLLAFLPSLASACNRCGRAQCIYAAKVVAPVHHAAAVVAVPHVKQADVFIVNNVYPGQPLVPQGQSLYSGGQPSYNTGALPFYDPNRHIAGALELQKAMAQTLSQANSETNALSQRFWELQAPTVETVARGNAASQVLRAAGLDPSHNVAGSQQAVVISRDQTGQLQVQQLNTQQVQAITAKVEARTTITPPAAREPNLAGTSLVTQFCGKCHGTDLAAPKGGLFIAADGSLGPSLRDEFFSITQRMTKPGAGHMPPEGSPQPTREEAAAILDEIAEIINTGNGK